MFIGINIGVNKLDFVPFEPSSIAGLKAWFDASDRTTLSSDGAASFTLANSERLEASNPASLSPGSSDFTFCGWLVAKDDVVGDKTIAGKWNTTGDQREWRIWLDEDIVKFSASTDGADEVTVSASPAIEIEDSHFIMASFDGTNLQISLDDGTAATQALGASSIFQGTADFNLGGTDNPTDFLTGYLDSLAYWSRILTSAEITFLFNITAGRVYADIGASGDGSDLLTNLVSWWNLSEPTGVTRIDAHGSNDLTDINTVVLVGSSISGQPEDGDVVTIWSGKSGFGDNLTQSTVANKPDRKSTRLNSSHSQISYAVF